MMVNFVAHNVPDGQRPTFSNPKWKLGVLTIYTENQKFQLEDQINGPHHSVQEASENVGFDLW